MLLILRKATNGIILRENLPLPINGSIKTSMIQCGRKAPSGFGYGIGKHNTLLDDMKGRYQSVYVRKEFTVLYQDTHRIKTIVLSVKCTGPFVAYLNMIEAIRSKKQGRGDQLILTGFGHELDPGINVLSIQCNNNDINSDSFSFILSFQLIEK
jgi:hypothetical protein